MKLRASGGLFFIYDNHNEMANDPIKLSDGTELVQLEKEEKEQLEAEILTVLNKYNAVYVPVVREEKNLGEISHKASLFLFKKKGIPTPFTPDGESKDEAPKTD